MSNRDTACLEATADGVAIHIKVVPNASRSRVIGMLGDRLKVAVAAAPEAGKANRAVCELISKHLDVPQRDIIVTAGQTQPRKTIEVLGVSLCHVAERFQNLS